VVCLIPSGPFKPYRAELGGKKQFFMRAVDTFYVPSVTVLRALFYPQTRAVFEVTARLEVDLDADRIAGRPEQRILSKCAIDLKNAGTATARAPYIVVHIDPKPEPGRIVWPPRWIGRFVSDEKCNCDSSYPIHPDFSVPLVTLGWSQPALMPRLPEICLAFEFYTENQPRQKAEVVFSAENFNRVRFEHVESVMASDS
jgi:hypothetical protein